ncbi:MAG: ATP-binding cassette domain-containing protein, partial [Rickettsiales bacterium]|nr:ATP-binding cassette domain-containing protein [Rickettsiales bacterium]
MSAPLLAIEDLSVAFQGSGGTVIAAQNVSLAISRGEILALVGESGSGKTITALSVLKLLPYPKASHPSGKILLEGKNLLDQTEAQIRTVRGQRISMIFQEP